MSKPKIVLAESTERAMHWVREQGGTPYDFIVIKDLRTIEGLRFRYEDVIRLSGWSKRSDIEELEERILRTHITMDICTYGTSLH